MRLSEASFGRRDHFEGRRRIGHSHFWQHAMSRRRFLKTTGGTAGVVLSSGIWLPLLANAGQNADPRPVPGTTDLGPLGKRHFFFPTTNPFSTVTVESGQGDPSLITDFKGAIGVADLEGTGTGTNTDLLWACDLRFMKGRFVGVDGDEHKGTFALI